MLIDVNSFNSILFSWSRDDFYRVMAVKMIIDLKLI